MYGHGCLCCDFLLGCVIWLILNHLSAVDRQGSLDFEAHISVHYHCVYSSEDTAPGKEFCLFISVFLLSGKLSVCLSVFLHSFLPSPSFSFSSSFHPSLLSSCFFLPTFLPLPFLFFLLVCPFLPMSVFLHYAHFLPAWFLPSCLLPYFFKRVGQSLKSK